MSSVLFIACKEDKTKTHSLSEKKYEFLFKPSPSRYYYTIFNETKTEFEVNGKQTEKINKSTVGLIYEVVSNTNNQVTVKIIYDSLHTGVKTDDGEREMDAVNTYSFDPAERMLASLKGSSEIIKLNQKGEIVSVEGNEEITGKLMSLLMNETEANKKAVKSQLSSIFGEDFLKTYVISEGVMPDSKVYVGNSWTREGTQTSELNINYSSVYTLKSIKNNKANIETRSQLKNTNNAVMLMGSEVNAQMEGKEEGDFVMDVNTGMLINGDTEVAIKGAFTVMGRQIPVTIQTKRNIELRKL